jgi:Mg2+ and Co2+ transporter CorA
MGIRARLYDAKGDDRDVRLSADVVRGLTDDTLLWVDVAQPNETELDGLARAFAFAPPILAALKAPGDQARLVRAPDSILMTILAVEPRDEGEEPIPVDLIASRNAVVTLHAGEVEALTAFEAEVGDEGALGKLDAAAFLGALVDTALVSFNRQIEEIEREIDRLDEVALSGDDPAGFLRRVVALRRRTSVLRRILVPQRETFGPLSRPDFELHDELGRPWPGLVERLERAIEGVERARQILLGSSDVYIARSAQRSGDVMRALTVVSAVLLPAVVLAGIMGMNFDLAFFDDPRNFWLVMAAMPALAVLTLAVARFRGWI